MKRSYNYQRIRSHRPYTITSLAELFEINPATVRRWIKKDGLDTAVTSWERPIILSGAMIKGWMKARQRAKRQPCAANEVYCVGCKLPRRIHFETLQIIQHKAKTLTVRGGCIECGLTIQRFGSVANRPALEAAFRSNSPDSQAAYPAPNSIPHSPLKCPLGEGLDACPK